MNNSLETRRMRDEDANCAFQLLRRAFVDGQITLAEFEEQVGRVYSTRGSLAPLDASSRYRSTAWPSLRESAPAQVAGAGEHVTSYLLVMAMLVAIWAMTGAGYFWLIWPMMGWGIGVASHLLGVRMGCHSDQPRHRRHGRSFESQQ